MSLKGNFVRSIEILIVLMLLFSTPAHSDNSLEGRLLERIAQEKGIGIERLEVGAFDRFAFPLTGLILYQAKIFDTATGEVYCAVVDEGGIPRSLEDARRVENAAYENHYGRLDPGLYDQLQPIGDGDRLTVAIWLKAGDMESIDRSAFEHQPTAVESGDVELPPPNLSQPKSSGPIKEDEVEDTFFLSRVSAIRAQQARLGVKITAEREKNLEGLKVDVSNLQAPLLLDLSAQGYKPVYVSPIAPLVYVELPKSEILRLSQMEHIDSIYGPHENYDEVNTARETQKADAVNLWGFDGSGVSVAILEDSRVEFNNIYLNSGTTRVPGDPNVDEHATATAGIVASQHSTYKGIAPGVILFSANATNFSDANLSAAMDWAVAQGVDIINNSWGSNLGSNSLNEHDRHLDYIVRNNWITAVKSAGNDGAETGRISSPGRGFNMITVGNYEDNNSPTWVDDSMNNTSSYLNPSTGVEKPEVAAVGSTINSTTHSSPWIDYVGSGTSFSAPMVSGEAALLLGRDSNLKTWPEAVKAILMATALHNIEGNSRLSDKDGAGGVDMQAAFRVADEGWWAGRVVDETSFPYSYYVYAYEGETVRVAIAWDSNPDSGYTTDPLDADIDMEVYDPSGGYVTRSDSSYNSYEIVEFTASITGDYELRIDDWRFNGATEYVGAAWWPGHRVLTAYNPQTLDTPPVSGDYFSIPAEDNWNAVGIRSPNGGNYNIYLYADSAFGNPDEHDWLEDSVYDSLLVDYVVIDCNHAPSCDYYTEVRSVSATGNYPVEWASHTENVNTGIYGPYSMTASQVIRVWDVSLDAGVRKYLAVKPISGNADLGMGLHDSDAASTSRYQGRSQSVASADSAGVGGDEYMSYQPSTGDWMGLVIWNNGAGSTTSYYLYADTSAPTGTIEIEGGADYTNSTSVSLNLPASDAQTGVVEMRFYNDGSSWTAWEPYIATRDWTLTTGDGDKTVYVQYRNNAGMISSVYEDTIILDTVVPVGSILIDDGASYTNSTLVILTLSASDERSGVAEMVFSDDGSTWMFWEDYATSKSWDLPPGDDLKTVYVLYRDRAGNISASYSDTIILDTQGPTGTILIESGASYTKSTLVMLNLSASDSGSGVVDMHFSDNESTWSDWEFYRISKAWLLPSGDGPKTIYVQFRDNAGNVSSYSDMIVLDTTAPSSSAVSPVSTNTLSFVVSWSGSDGLSGVANYDMQYRAGSSGAWSDWLLGITTTSETFGPESPVIPTRGETYYFRVRAYDNAGNVEAYPSSPDTSTFVEKVVEIFLPLVVR